MVGEYRIMPKDLMGLRVFELVVSCPVCGLATDIHTYIELEGRYQLAFCEHCRSPFVYKFFLHEQEQIRINMYDLRLGREQILVREQQRGSEHV